MFGIEEELQQIRVNHCDQMASSGTTHFNRALIHQHLADF
jgi:hypothetical protein